MEVANAVGEDGEYSRNGAETGSVSSGDYGGEAGGGAIVSVEDFGGGGDDRGVPVVVGGVYGWLMRF